MAAEKNKPGIKTTEFWATVVSAAVIAGADMLGHTLSQETVAGIVATVVGYALARFGVKKATA